MTKITIVDYGMGNLHSVKNKLERLGFSPNVSNNKDVILSSDKIILPGVGHFGKGMSNINTLEIKAALNEFALIQKKPILGICLGMQLLTEYSEEGDSDGLGYISGKTQKFQFENKKLKIPHMGWNSIQIKKECPLFNGITENEMFYFVHSFYVDTPHDYILAETVYGIKFTSAFWKDNIYGVQFHPEKSHEWGTKIMQNFCEL